MGGEQKSFWRRTPEDERWVANILEAETEAVIKIKKTKEKLIKRGLLLENYDSSNSGSIPETRSYTNQRPSTNAHHYAQAREEKE